MVSQPNVLVKIDRRGAFKVYVAGQPIVGVQSVHYDSQRGDYGKLTIEIIGSMVEFDVVEEPLMKRLVSGEAA